MVAAVVGVVVLGTAAAAVEPPPHSGGAARKDAACRPVVGGTQMLSVGTGVILPMLAEQLCEGESHEVSDRGSRLLVVSGRFVGLARFVIVGLSRFVMVGTTRFVIVGKGVEGIAAFLLADLGDVEVADGVLDRAVTQVASHLEDGGSGFQHVRGEAVAQSVGGNVLVGFGKSAFRDGDLDGLPDGGFAHRLFAALHRLLDGQARSLPTTTDTRKEPLVIAMEGPKLPKTHEHLRSDGHFAGFVDFRFCDDDDESLSFDVTRPDADGFVQAQATLVDEGAEGAEADVAKGPQETVDFVASEDLGQGLVSFDVDLLPDVPVDAEVITVEGAQGADRLVHRAGPELPFVLEVDEEVEHALGWEFRQVGLRVMIGELVDPAVVCLATALGEAFELDKTGEVLIPLG